MKVSITVSPSYSTNVVLNPCNVSSSLLKLICIYLMSIENKQFGISLPLHFSVGIGSSAKKGLPNLSPYPYPTLTWVSAVAYVIRAVLAIEVNKRFIFKFKKIV